MYAKLIDGVLKLAPKYVTYEDNNIWNASAEVMQELSWKIVTTTEPPESPSGYYYKSEWEEQDEAIVQTWVLMPISEDIDEAEAYNIIFGGGV